MSDSTSTATRHLFSHTTTRGQVLRFILVGGTNTVCSTLLFYGLTFVLPARVAFSITYVLGLTYVVIAVPRYVFGSRVSWTRRILLAVWYVCTYFVGIGMIALLESAISAPRVVVVLGTVAVTAPLGFLGGRLLVYGRSTGGSTPSG